MENLEGENQAPDQGKEERKPFFTAENAAENGRKGGLTSSIARSKRKGPEWLTKQAETMVVELVNAAEGKGKWKALPIDKQFAALLKVLEYGFGKPATAKKNESEPGAFDLGIPGIGGDV